MLSLKAGLTTSTGLGVPGLSVLSDLARFLASENDPDLLRAVNRTGTFNKLDIGTDAIPCVKLLLELMMLTEE